MKQKIKPEFYLPTKIYVKQDIIADIGDITAEVGSRVILITTSSDFEIFGEVIDRIMASYREADVNCIIYDEIPPDPTTEDLDEAAAYLKKSNCDILVGFGGIHSMSAVKALSVLVTNYIFSDELIKTGKIIYPPMPFITVPGGPVFGMEIAPYFILQEIRGLTRQIFQDTSMYPVVTVADPAVSLSIPEEKYMKLAMSGLSMATESIISHENNDIINTYALKSIDLLFRNLHASSRDMKNLSPRHYISTSSIMCGIAFATASLSLTMALSLALVSKTGLELEDMMCVILPHIMEFNLTSSPGKYVQMSKVMGEDVKEITVIEAAIKAVEAIRKLATDMDIPQRLTQYGISRADFKDVAELAMSYPFLKNSPREISTNEMETILIAAY